MQRGRPRKPLPELLLEGRFREDRHGSAEQVWLPPSTLPDAPSWLRSEGRELWQRLAPQLSAVGVATDLDATELAALCEWWGRFREASQALDAVSERQSTEYYRLSILANMAWKNFSAAASKFGLNPSDRARLRLNPDGEQKDTLAEFVKAKE